MMAGRWSYKRFLDILARSKRVMTWEMEEGGEVRGKVIKGTKQCFCPITAVCFLETGKVFRDGDYSAAADTIKLPIGMAEAIVDTADCTRENLFFTDGDVALRKKLLATIGLKELADA